MMTTNPQIIVGIDGRPESAHVLDWAIREAAVRHASLVLVHAVGNAIADHPDRVGEDLGTVIGQATAGGQRLLAVAAARVRMLNPTVAVDECVSLEASVTALRLADPRATMVVVGSRSGHQVPSTLDGLETRLGTDLGCPVVEVTAASTSGGILAVADGTVWSLPILTAAFTEAALRRVPLTVVHVPDDEADDGLRGFLSSMLVRQVHDLLACFPTVELDLVTDQPTVLTVLAAAPRTMSCVVTDSDRLDAVPSVPVRLLVPSERPHAAPDEPVAATPGFDRAFEREFQTGFADDLESCWQLPAVEPPVQPQLVRVRVRRNPLRRFGHEHRPID